MRQFIWPKTKTVATELSDHSVTRFYVPVFVAHFTFAKEEWPYYQIPMDELCDATRCSDGCGGRVRECADRHGQDPYGNRKKHSSSTTASVVTNHSFWEEEALRCLYYTEKNSPCFAPRDSATSQLHTRTRLITDRFSDSWPAVHICIWDCQL